MVDKTAAFMFRYALVLGVSVTLTLSGWTAFGQVPPAGSVAPATAKGGAKPGVKPADGPSDSPRPADSVLIAVDLPGSGSYLAMAETAGAEPEAVGPPAGIHGPKAAVELPASNRKLGKIRLSMLDSGRQLIASRVIDISSGKAKVSLVEDDFDRFAAFPVMVTSGGKAVAQALVEITDSAGHRVGRQALLPGQGGIVTFRSVPVGKVAISVEYNDGQTATQGLTLDRATPADRRKAEISVSGAVATEPIHGTPAAGHASTGGTGADPAVPHRGGDSSPLDFIVALVVLAGVAFFGYTYVRNHPEALKSLAARLPDSDAQPLQAPPPPPVSVPDGACPFCGQMRDPISNVCACSLVAPSTQAPSPRLVALSGPLSGQSFGIRTGALRFGRETDREVALPTDPSVSRRHAVIESHDGSLLLRDEGSSNGTFVNGERISEAVLQPGDEFAVGSSRFRYEA